MKRTLLLCSSVFFVLTLAQCKKDKNNNDGPGDASYSSIDSEPQRSGDPTAGRDFLVTGNYIGSGIPYDLFTQVIGINNENVLNRSGDNAVIGPEFTAIDHANGTRVVSPNCFQCHGQKLRGQYIEGLGNSFGDFTSNGATVIPALDIAIATFYGADSDEAAAFANFRRGTLVTGPAVVTEVVGVNPADKLTQVLVAHRKSDDLTWLDDPQFTYDNEVVPTDVPAWWLMKKKNAEFYTGSGRGDHAKISTAAALLTLTDSNEARAIDAHAADVMAYIKSLDPPAFPEATDPILVDAGKIVFDNNCARCHGSYGENETYPNYLVPISDVGTDPFLADAHFALADFEEWYNGSWYGTTVPTARFETEGGYLAPPLDGVWATAPYLHNGSVPDLWTLLKSSDRPAFWRRTLDDMDYNLDQVGWNFTEETGPTDKQTYDTSLPGYSNQGHYFGDGLSDSDRNALIEYLKTL